MTHKENFIKKANIKYNNKFDYSKFEYINAKTKSTIICPIHGEFLQNPDKHLSSKYSCKMCEKVLKNKQDKRGIPNINKRISKKEFEQMFYEKYGLNYKLILDDNYSGVCGGVVDVMCNEHGIIKFNPRNMRNISCPCFECSNRNRAKSKTKPYEIVVEQLNEKHNGKYTYHDDNKLTYRNKKSIIKIICKEHGEFLKSAQKHLSGQGCFQCKIIELVANNILLGGYSNAYFENNPEKSNTNAVLYYIKIGDLYKIGITTNLYNRIRTIRSKSKSDVDIIFTKEYTLLEAFTIEQSILNLNENYRTYRKWSSELFDRDVSETILKYF